MLQTAGAAASRAVAAAAALSPPSWMCLPASPSTIPPGTTNTRACPKQGMNVLDGHPASTHLLVIPMHVPQVLSVPGHGKEGAHDGASSLQVVQGLKQRHHALRRGQLPRLASLVLALLLHGEGAERGRRAARRLARVKKCVCVFGGAYIHTCIEKLIEEKGFSLQ